MDYIDEYSWNGDKIINACDEKIINLKNDNMYLIKDNIVYIFYIKIYKLSNHKISRPEADFDLFETRNELLLSLYLKNSWEIKYKQYYYNKIEKCCEFCFNMTKDITHIIFADILICKNCLLTRREKNYYINNRLLKSTNNINIELVRKIGNNLIYFYSIQQFCDDFNYMRLLNPRWYQILKTKSCQLCRKNDKLHILDKLECLECHQFSLNQYYIILMKARYFKLVNDLHFDVINFILKYYITLIDFDKRDFINYYDQINCIGNEINEINKNIEVDINTNIKNEDEDDIYLEIYNDEYIDDENINDINNDEYINNDDLDLIDPNSDDECDLTNYDDY
jgi:hypothetical protein